MILVHVALALVLILVPPHPRPGGMFDPSARLDTTEVNDLRGMSYVDDRENQR